MALEHAEPLSGSLPADAARDASPNSFLSPEDRLLVTRARAGDQRALRQIYEAHHHQVRGHLFRLVGPDPDVDDLVQTVFARAFLALDGFRANSTLSTWLYRITANTTHNLLRQRFRRERVKSALHWFDRGRSSSVSGNGVEARDEAQRVLLQLHPDLREIFVLYHYEGMTLHEISQILDRPVSTIGDRLTRARKRLRELVH
jgi:RNA polymerase sigma-70 factor (ECF subfamily)